VTISPSPVLAEVVERFEFRDHLCAQALVIGHAIKQNPVEKKRGSTVYSEAQCVRNVALDFRIMHVDLTDACIDEALLKGNRCHGPHGGAKKAILRDREDGVEETWKTFMIGRALGEL